ncbi:MAG TPA: type II secretion system F family protein [Methylomirabilota bacterium]|nr:type II secretion system F family protein [Methylomirabilota bacterium]
MPNFQYTARTKAGTLQKDVMAGANQRTVVDALRAQGLIPVSIRIASAGLNWKASFDFIHKIKLLDKITFIKNLSVMIKAGLPLSRALKVIAVQTPNPKFAKVVADISRMVEGGTALADSLAKYPDVFSAIFVSMVRVGEVSGNLDQNLTYLAEQMQRDYDLMSKAKGSLTYPIIVMGALVIVGFLMFTFVLPKLTATFTEANVALPLTTRVVIFVVNIFAHYGILVMLGFIGLIFGFIVWRRSDMGRTVLHKVILYTPVISTIVIKINLARFVRVFASLIRSGMSIVEALEVSSHVVGNIYYQRVIADAGSKVKMGAPLTSAFKKEPKLFSNLVIQMMEVGEESGTTEAVLTEVANFYESEVDQTMKNLSSILEPVMMMVIGVVVGFLALALITPIYSITQSIN